jgi:hypothetical protein
MLRTLVRQTLAALLAAALQQSAAGSGCHALQKTMFFRTLSLLWLVSSFWHTTFTLTHLVAKKQRKLY